MTRIRASDFIEVNGPAIVEGFIEVKCFCKHFVNGRLIKRKQVSLRTSGRNMRGSLRAGGALDQQGGVVQFVWQVNIAIAITPVGRTSGRGEIVQSIEYLPPDANGRVRLRPLRRSNAMPRTSGLLDIGFDVQAPEGRTSGARSTFNSAFDIRVEKPRGSSSVTVGPISLGGSSSASTTSIFCMASSGFTLAG